MISRKVVNRHQLYRADIVFRGRMASTNFLSHPAFKYDFLASDFRNFTFGAVSGPYIQIENLFHDIGHAIEFVLTDQDLEYRCREGGFCFDLNQIELGGQLYHQLESIQCTEREIRAFAIQIKFMHSIGFKRDLDDFAKDAGELAMWLPDFLNIENASNDIERKAWVKSQVIEYYNSISTEQIFKAFNIWLDQMLIIQSINNEKTTAYESINS